ncbi:GINS3 [Cervus elaphus hippelaphus]|uniref:DNA replication complex GINS protein PSF3 n=1 Tax=Cervus elaphus hippelaphus TaxID=46360 RepID=A0A212DD53_CEREH|nr:GINS3 [Cervus elaphus hippelaphus]
MSEAYFRVESGALGSEENFLSLDDILMSHEKLPVRTEIPMPRLGAFFLDRSGGAETDNAIPEGTKLELPLWLAKGLFDNKRRILSVELPKIYQEGWRTVFSADANVVDLHKMGPHFYGFGSQLLHFDSPENADISHSLLQAMFRDLKKNVSDFSLALLPQTFVGRFRRIMDSSQNAYNEDTSALVARLDEMERGLFQTGQKGLNDFQCWEKGQASQLTASNLVQNYAKRKFTDMED